MRLVHGVLSSLFFELVACHQATAMSVTEQRLGLEESPLSEIVLSLWLVPPLPTAQNIANQISTLSQDGTKAPLFAPHITVVGGIKCRSEEHVLEVAKTLEQGLGGFGKIPCLASSKAYTGKGVWNQALYLAVEPSAALLNLCQKARALLGMDTESWTFPRPAAYPHISMFYGIDNVPDTSKVESIPPFHAYRLALWRTDPPTLEGVALWKEIIAFDIK